MSERAERALSDAGIEFDPDSGDVRGPGGSARLAPQPAALLALLSRQAGSIVTRDELKEHLWPGGRVEFDQGIAFALREVRKTFEEVGADPAVIETLPRRGLRLKGPDGEGPRPRRAASVVWVVVALVSLLVGVAGGLGWATRSAGPPVLVVFPYASAGDAANGTAVPAPADADVVALTEAVVVALTSALDGEAGVVGPAGVTGLLGPDDVEGASSALGACLLLSGSVRLLAPDTLVVFTQIVRTSDRVHVWAQQDTLHADSAPGVLSARIVEGARGVVARC